MQVPPYGYAVPQIPEFSAADQSSLDSLAIFHFVYAGLIALSGCGVLAFVLFGLGAMVAAAPHVRGSGGVMFGGAWIVVVMGFAIAVLFLKAFLVFYSGLNLKRTRHKTLSQIVACLCCVNFPMGTALGVFTLVTLNRPAIAARYLLTASGSARG
ncbi:MAG TPA: hypothetical protein VER96_32545 [Polyangiaceae bacterium]|nr:hypothetical protein [Polyangiaceae bacterium]